VTGVWWSQPFAPEGSATAAGIIRQLGRPGLDEITILVREAAQNAWDARSGGQVEFDVSIEKIGSHAGSWNNIGLPRLPSGGNIFDSDNYIIQLSDRGTHGLRGPLRASERPRVGEGNDFVQFLRNVGERRDSELGGGTYGFGKGILYRVSRVSAILADSQVAVGGKVERRIMGASLGADFYENDTRYTGRHWWGALASDGVPDPLIGDDAERIAGDLGLRPFDNGATGSNIVILSPDFGSVALGDETSTRDRTPAEVGDYLVSALLWNLWPKMLGDTPAMLFHVTVDGHPVSIPRPGELPALRPFVRAYEKIHSDEGDSYLRGGDCVGKFASVLAPRALTTDTAFNIAKPFTGPPQHVARMRWAELVVDYLEYPVDMDDKFCYGGVFRAEPSFDSSFANSEPPTHDSWVEQGLERDDLLIVRGARVWIRSRLRSQYQAELKDGDSRPGLGALAARLASLVPDLNTHSSGAASQLAKPQAGSGRTSSSGDRKSRISDAPRVLFKNGAPFIVATVDLGSKDKPYSLLAHAQVVLEGGAKETEAPAGGHSPQVIGWESHDGVRVANGATLNVTDETSASLLVVATFIPDAVVRLSLEETA
jgi:hypothetical protein